MTGDQPRALPDVLGPSLRVVFVGTAQYSVKVGAYYAKPGNRFWPALHEVRITPRLFRPSEYAMLIELGLGLTDLCKRQVGMDHLVKPDNEDLLQFGEKLERYRPHTVAFTGKKSASYWLKTPTRRLTYGRQTTRSRGLPEVFVLPSPSGAARSHWSIAPWQALAEWLAAARAR